MIQIRSPGVADEHRWADHLARSVENYRRHWVEYFAMKVVSRGLFLTVSVMLVFLYVIDLTTSLMPGINEITVRDQCSWWGRTSCSCTPTSRR